MLFNFYFIFLLYITIFISYITSDEVSSNQIKLIISSYQNNVLKHYEEALEFTANGTVWKYNIAFNLKRFFMKIEKRQIERDIEKLLTAKSNNSSKINQSKLVKEINSNEKSFLKLYRQLLNIKRDSNELYIQCLYLLKKAFIICITVIIIITLITIGVMLYITSPKWRKYNMLINEKEKEENDKTDNESNDNKQFKVVKILNNIMKSDKKLK